MSINLNELNLSPLVDDIKYFVSGSDLEIYFPNCKIVKFSNLDEYKSIYDLLPGKIDFCFILVETTGVNVGHWQLLYRDKDTFNFFDSYGDKPTSILNFIPKSLNKYLGNDYREDMGHILKSIKKPDKLVVNSFPFQSNIDGVNTCGRWVLARLAFFLRGGMENRDFIKYIKEATKTSRLRRDEVVVRLISV